MRYSIVKDGSSPDIIVLKLHDTTSSTWHLYSNRIMSEIPRKGPTCMTEKFNKFTRPNFYFR